jgi:hypothetical protein
MFYRQMLFPEKWKKAVGSKHKVRDFLPIGRSNRVTSVLSLEFPNEIKWAELDWSRIPLFDDPIIKLLSEI